MNNNVLILGQDSYIGTRFAEYAADRFVIETADARNDQWKNTDLAMFGVVLCVAGIAHVKQKKSMKPLYDRVNTKLPIEAAAAAKAAGVKHFVFLSTMAVDTSPAGDLYADSKRAAEQGLTALAAPDFIVSIIRPPMVYGAGCRGNFPRLARLAVRAPVFPDIANRRSMIYIDNLCEFLCQCIAGKKGGTHKPQNAEHVSTTVLARHIAAAQGKELRTTRLFNLFVRLMARFLPSLSKLFGSLYYPLTGEENLYNVISFEESVKLSVCTNI